jgi:hypothetical protein
VEAALDKRSSMGILGNLDNFMKFQSANAVEAAAKNPAGEASAGVGMGMGFAMANQLGKAMATPQQPPALPLEETEIKYYVGKNGKKAGPFARDAVAGYIQKGAIGKETLLWKEGMDAWKAAETFSEFEPLLKATPPPLPQ